MATLMKRIAIAGSLLFVVSLVANTVFPQNWLLSLAITCGTITYHFLMRLLVGFAFDRVMGNRADYTRGWYQIHPFEVRLYDRLQVKRWKRHMPAYDPSLFDPKLHSWDEIAQAMCQAELVHETIVVLSFLPLLFSLRWGAFPVFLVTSLCAALFDAMFAVMQRYNRPRILKLALKVRS